LQLVLLSRLGQYVFVKNRSQMAQPFPESRSQSGYRFRSTDKRMVGQSPLGRIASGPDGTAIAYSIGGAAYAMHG